MYLEDNPYIDPTELCHRQTVHRWCNRLWGTIYNFLNHVHPKIYRLHNPGTSYLPISLCRANNQCMSLLQVFRRITQETCRRVSIKWIVEADNEIRAKNGGGMGGKENNVNLTGIDCCEQLNKKMSLPPRFIQCTDIH